MRLAKTGIWFRKSPSLDAMNENEILNPQGIIESMVFIVRKKTKIRSSIITKIQTCNFLFKLHLTFMEHHSRMSNFFFWQYELIPIERSTLYFPSSIGKKKKDKRILLKWSSVAHNYTRIRVSAKKKRWSSVVFESKRFWFLEFDFL